MYAGGVFMFVEKVKNNGVDYLRLVKGVRVTNKDGYRTSQKKVILNIGPLSRFDDGLPDYVDRLRKSFKAGNPLIPALLPYCENNVPMETYRFSFNEGSPDCFGHPKIFSHIIFERILEELGLNAFFSSYKALTKLKYDVYGFAKLLIFGRFLNPDSKSATVRQNDNYYEPILNHFNPDNVYDTLDFIADNKDKIIRRINTNLCKKAHRDPSVIYYDVTNFFFETENADEDITTENDVIVKGLRQRGVSKENRKLPIVQMGLFMDDSGIPIAIEAFPGNTLDHLTLRPALKKNIDDLDFSRFILIADRGICSYANLIHILDAGNGYIVSKSLLKSKSDEQYWAYSGDDYIIQSEAFKYKSRIIKRNVKDENGRERTIEEKVIVYWSKKFQQRCEKENKKFLEFLKKLEEAPNSFRITAQQSKSLRKFLKDECINVKTGEVIQSSEIKAFIDFDKVNDYRKSMGYYQIVTSELTMDTMEVIDKYHGLTQIEEQFKTMKGDLATRPFYVRTPEHINAHMIICLIALIMVRIIQKQILSSGLADTKTDMYWTYGMSAERIREALNKWKVDMLPGDLYRFMDGDNPDLQLILKSFDIDLKPKLYRRAELKSLKSNMKLFI